MSYSGLAGFGFQALGGILGFFGGRARAKYQRKMQAYRNAMVRLSDANNQNSITLNSIQNLDQSVRKAAAIKRAAMVQEGQAEVAAAAAGVTGNSVASTMRGLQRSASRAERARQLELKSAFMAVDQQRQNSSLSAAMQIDRTHIAGPSIGATLLGLGAQGLAAYDDGAFDSLPSLFGSSPAPTTSGLNDRFAFSSTFGDALRQNPV